ncbi:CHAT domain-containing tetratricopeptide repeat protein [Actinomadura oligospora]|uniref:CHAT domain-containing tetratricopeptide repeat protein n=1 Tax=Actinomadura oligospora TaxID=111804 RepID=UPI00047E2A5B|nr:CHAT domain-containing protein [Actinomadura oligospora]
MDVPDTHPVARHFREAVRKLNAGDVPAGDAAFSRAVEAAGRNAELRVSVMEAHVVWLQRQQQIELAQRRATAYVEAESADAVGLRLLRAELYTAQGDHTRAASAAETLLAERADRLTPHQVARVRRILGLAEANAGHENRALELLDQAQQAFVSQPDFAWAVTEIAMDIAAVRLRAGYPSDLASAPPRTVADHLRHAERLRFECRYEDAWTVLQQSLGLPGMDQAMHWLVLREFILLAVLLRLPHVLEQLDPLLDEAAAHAPDATLALRELERLRTPGSVDDPSPGRLDGRLQHVRHLVRQERLDEATERLWRLASETNSPRDTALWRLAATETLWKRVELAPTDHRSLDECILHARRAVEEAGQADAREFHIEALWRLGHALLKRGGPGDAGEAMRHWVEARERQSKIALLQRTDRIVSGMLETMPTEYDHLVEATVTLAEDAAKPRAAAVAVAVEGARGALILPMVVPPGTSGGALRDLPGPGDWKGARNWAGTVAGALAIDQAAWLMHATPERVHHVLITTGSSSHVSLSCDRDNFKTTVENLAMSHEHPGSLATAVRDGGFEAMTAALAKALGIEAALELIPSRVQRIAVVAGGDVADVPLGALPMPTGEGPLGLRYALSDLPCLRLLTPLRDRAARRRGDDILLVDPQHGGLTTSRARTSDALLGPEATPQQLEACLAQRRHDIVRIDAHGTHDPDNADRSFLELSPAGPDGKLTSRELAAMDLRGCGTLVLGACESGMSQKLGRDERHGFVRAGLRAGAAAVVAARWIALDDAAAPLLDVFQHRLRHLPRDLALREAFRDLCALDERLSHPAHWACWTLYGDAGPQTAAGPLRRWVRRHVTDSLPRRHSGPTLR